MSSLKLVPILEVGDMHEEMIVRGKSKAGEKCPGTGEGPCGEYYFLMLESIIRKGDVRDVRQCDACRQIVQRISCY
jgi:hypothetical protein